jgi:very-short-patch-repair endonuclease
MPAPEARLWNVLRQLRPQFHFRRQVQIGPYYADFLCHSAKLVIEVDGESHFVDGGPQRDCIRARRFARDGFQILRFTNPEVMDNLEGVYATIRANLETPHP